ncbi:MAG: hypothetical protein FWC89_13745 [Defluviitaleaceae bacterium]|nr:hypothetical protein [Defluviitaleaceae bacterium]
MNNDEKIRELFNQIHTPEYDILKGVKQSMENKNKISARPRISVAAAIIAAVFILTTGVVVAAYSTGGFARLLGIVGADYAESLTPIEIELGADGFATPFIPGYTSTDDEFRIEIVAINLNEAERAMYIYVTLEDLTGDRRDCEFNTLSFVMHTRDNAHLYDFAEAVNLHQFWGNITAEDIIDRCEESGILTLRNRFDIQNDDIFMDGEVTITFGQLRYNDTSYMRTPINLDLSTVTQDPETIRIVFDSDLEWIIGISETYLQYQLQTEGIDILKPNQNPVPLNLQGIRTQITAVGIIDGNLHVQIYTPPPFYETFAAISLQVPGLQPMQAQAVRRLEDGSVVMSDGSIRNVDGTITVAAEVIAPEGATPWEEELTLITRHANMALMFNLRPDNTAYQSMFNRESKFPVLAGGFSNNLFQEYVWYDVDLNNLQDYTLYGIFHNADVVWLEWTTSFEVR